MKYLFFVNPAAGKGKAQKKIIMDIEEYFNKNGKDYDIIITEYPDHAEKVAREMAETGEELSMFACGGEGTGYEVINGIVGFDNVSYGIIPCGSANDFVRGFKNPKCFADIKAQVEGEAYPIDLIRANDRYCINSCSVGMDAVVARDMRSFKKLPFVSGSLAYNLAIVKTFLKKLGVRLKLKVDDTEFGQLDCLFAVIANGPFYGGGYMAAPKAVPFDRRLDFIKVDVISKLRILGLLSKYKSGTHEGLDCCTIRSCNEMYFEADKPLPVNLDGETIETDCMKFSLLKSGLKFIIPKGELAENETLATLLQNEKIKTVQ
ncbi:MAG: diacylglycerol kinase family lipid kinase [Oscillospiraceae bacterium]|nr:diacylglycerol kinase family lipid kinase [Oscillospiraceae bacterium]